jgi:hypothetical protein
MRSVEMLALWARLLPLFTALLVALPLGVGGGASYVFCHGMGRVVDKCCCPSPAPAIPTAMGSSCGAKVQPRDCCERIEHASGNVAAAFREKAGHAGFLPALVEAIPVVLRGCAPSERSDVPEPVEARAPRPRGPPLFLANCSFLT